MKISTPLAIAIIVILAVILIGGIFIYQYRFSLPEIPFVPKPGVSFSNDCNELMRQINNLVEKANYCSVDSDCLISTDVTKFCGCWGLINKNADLSKINAGQAKYEKLNCPVLVCAECMLLPQQDDIKCVNNKCIDTRIVKKPSENLEQCIAASSFDDYFEKIKVEISPIEFKNSWKNLKPVTIPVPINLSGIEIYQVPTGGVGGDIIETTVIKTGDNYCKFTENNARILFAPIKQQDVIKYLKFRFNTLAAGGSDASKITILSNNDYGKTDTEKVFCERAGIDFLSVAKKITTVEETTDSYLINWVFFTQVYMAGYYEEGLKIGKDAKIQILKWPETPFINCGPGIIF